MSSANSFIIYDCHPLKDALDQTKRVAGNPEHAFVDAGYRGHLKGVVSEQLNAFLNSAGMNFHKLLRWKAAFLRQIFYWLLSYQRATTIAANSAKWAFQDRLLQKGLTRSILSVDADDLASAMNPISEKILAFDGVDKVIANNRHSRNVWVSSWPGGT